MKAGARVLTGGEIFEGPGNFYPLSVAKEEFFGQVVMIYAFTTETRGFPS